MAGLCAPLSTLRQYPHGYLRMTRGRCGSLLLHRDGLAPSTPCRSPGALRSTPKSGHRPMQSPCPKRARRRPFDHLIGELLQLRGHVKAEGLRGLEVDDQAKLGKAIGKLDRRRSGITAIAIKV